MNGKWMLVALFSSAIVAGAVAAPVARKPVPAAKLGLAPGDVLESAPPAAVKPETEEPGEGRLLRRWNPVAPPMVPHGVEDFLPITRQSNPCVDCHVVEQREEGGPVPMSASHRKPGSSEPDGRRWICVTCHAPQTEAPALPAVTHPHDSKRK